MPLGEESKHERPAEHGAIDTMAALGAERGVVSAQSQKILMQRIHAAMGMTLAEVQNATGERLLVRGIVEGSPLPVVDDAGELCQKFRPAFAHQQREVGILVGKI